MSDVLALEPSPLLNERAVRLAPRLRFGAMFKALLESLVSAQTRPFDETGPVMYRYPPI
jgi:hypothetical protein